MITIGEMQVSGMLTMLILSLMLVLCVPHRSVRRNSFARARWMMAAGTGLIAVQFMLQYIFGFRQMGVTQAVLCNLLLFTPASLLCSMAILYMQRHGDVSRREWATASTICGISALILLGTVLFDGIPFAQESLTLRMAEYVAAVFYVAMQTYIFVMQLSAHKRLEQAMDEYYDRERRDLFGWMGWSMKAMALLAFLVPVVTFLNGLPLVMFSIAYFFCISYSTISLYSYGISRDVERVEEAEKSEELRIKSEELLPAESLTRNTLVAEAVERWKASGEYRTHNLTLGIVAQQMGVPARHLQEWLRQSEYKKLAGMVAALRIEEAQRALREHPEWSVESVADYCGFNDRKYFHHVFQQQTGTTPSKYQQESNNL